MSILNIGDKNIEDETLQAIIEGSATPQTNIRKNEI